ncbi:MAG: 16S rRNA (cytosine(967)-C(5))-methyltransferase RsmB [Clostridiales bacterium]|nr:16S rRNA (cytosine(967)-C(5))-methyltransferase RsmB [Clostridiales bacterium]
MNNAFLKSYETLRQIYAERAFSSIALNKTLSYCKQQDKSLITKIVYGVLDNDIKLEYIISRHVKKMPKGDTLIFLKIGTYCLAELSIPVYAVVNDVAELSKISEDRRIVGFVNATLKSIATGAKDFNDYPTEPVEKLSIKYSYPEWALRKLVKDYGMDTATSIVTFPADNRTTVRFTNCTNFKTVCKNNALEVESSPFDDAVFVKGNLPVDSNEYTVQSLSSMAISRICSNLLGEGDGFLDCCAAPGGKSVYVKQLKPSVHVTSCDIHPHRVELIEKYAQRMGVTLATVCQDMTEYLSEYDSKYDVVLCDVPCSGFGVLNNRPDIKLFRENKDISELMKLQYAILSNCSRYVKAGGYIVYSTCTVFDNENGQNVRKFLKEHANFAFDTITLPEFINAHGSSYYQFLPHKDGVQGFYVAVLKRVI